MENYSLSISSVLNTAWEYTKRYGLLIAVIYLLVGMLSGGLGHISTPTFSYDYETSRSIGEAVARGDWQTVGSLAPIFSSGNHIIWFGGMLGNIVRIIVSVGLYNLALGLMAGRFSEVTFDAFRLPFATYIKVFVVEFITHIIILVSVLCCIIPVFFVAPRVLFAPVYQVEHPESGVFESISASWDISSGNTFSLLGLGIIMIGIGILGFCCCCIGVFIAEAFTLFTLVAAYRALTLNDK